MLSDLYLFFNEHWDSIWLSHLQTLRSHRFYQQIHQTLPRGWKKGTEYQDPSAHSEFSRRWTSFIHKMLLTKGFSCVRKTTLIKEGRSLQINILSILKWENQDTQCLSWLVGWLVGGLGGRLVGGLVFKATLTVVRRMGLKEVDHLPSQ